MFLRRFSYSIVTRGIVAIINLIVLIISSRYLGVETRGEISLLILNIANVQMISEVFTGYALVHFIPRFSLKKIMLYGLLWVLAVVVLGSGVLYYLGYLIQGYEKEFLLGCLMVLLNTFCMVIVLGKENIRLYNWLSVLQPLILLLVLSFNIFVEKRVVLSSYFDALFYSFGITLFINIFTIWQYLKKDEKSAFGLSNILSNGFLSQWSNWMHLLSNRFSYYVLSGVGLNWLGIYSTATSLIESVFVVYGGISTVVLSYVSNEDDENRAKEMSVHSAMGSFVVTLMALIVLLVIPESWIVWILGEGFKGIKMPMMILSFGVLMISYSAIFSHYFSGTGVLKYNAVSNTVACLFTILFSHLFIQKWDLGGAALVAGLSYAIEAVLVSYFFARHSDLKIKKMWRWDSFYKIRGIMSKIFI